MSCFVLLHGFTGAPAAFDELARHLPGRVVREWLPGHGPDPDAVQSWSEEVSRLGARLRERGVRDADLVGYSFGGRLGWHLLDRDDLFRSATLIGAHPGLPERARAQRREDDARWIALLEREGVRAFVDRWQALPMWNSQASLPPEMLAAQRRTRLAHTARGLADALRHLGLAEMPERPRARIPFELVAGSLDHRFMALTHRLNLLVRSIAGVGHNVVLEAPGALSDRITNRSAQEVSP